MGVGTTLGTGIFFALAETVPLAGPGVLLSFFTGRHYRRLDGPLLCRGFNHAARLWLFLHLHLRHHG